MPLNIQKFKIKPIVGIDKPTKKPTDRSRGISDRPGIVPIKRYVSRAGFFEMTPQQESRIIDRYEKTELDEYPVGTKIGVGDAPTPTREQIEHFKANREKIMEDLVKKDVKRNKGIVHGKRMANRFYEKQLGHETAKEHELSIPTQDWDVWVRRPISRADRMQQTIDRRIGADVAYAKKEISPQDSKSRWTVRTRESEDPDVDYVAYPDPFMHPYESEKENGIRYETMKSFLARAKALQYQPFRFSKAYADLQRWKHYQELKEKEAQRKKRKK